MMGSAMSDNLPNPKQLSEEIGVVERTAQEIIDLVMLCEPPNTGDRQNLLDQIINAIQDKGEKWEEFRFEILVNYQFKIIYRAVQVILQSTFNQL